MKISTVHVILSGNQISKNFTVPFKVNGKEICQLEDLHKALNEMCVVCFQQNDETPAVIVPVSSILDVEVSVA